MKKGSNLRARTFKMEAVLFDMDGTLVHTEPEYVSKIVRETLLSFNAENPRDDDIRYFWFGANREDFVQKVWGINPSAFFDEYMKLYAAEAKAFSRFYDDVAVTLEALKARNVKIGIVTAGVPKITNHYLDRLKGYVSASVSTSQEPEMKPKPHPEAVLKCLKLLHVNPGMAMFVGNGEEDILAGKRAGVTDVFIDRGEHNLLTVMPSHTIKTLPEVLKLAEH
ncbi:HAD-IA family hydrolase [Candidatus Woesearchaeota archaeon]|nr:HAD-IA family hydrolase [Candidatus Woesearchaeota archaeon]